MKKTNVHIANIIKEFGMEPKMKQVAEYCYKHYASITGTPTSHRDHEMDFPEEIVKICAWFESHYGYDFMDFTFAWGN